MAKFVGQDEKIQELQTLTKEVNPKRIEILDEESYKIVSEMIYYFYMHRNKITKDELRKFLSTALSIDLSNLYEVGKLDILKNEIFYKFEKWSYVPPEEYRKLNNLRIIKKAQRKQFNLLSFVLGQLVMLMIYIVYSLIFLNI